MTISKEDSTDDVLNELFLNHFKTVGARMDRKGRLTYFDITDHNALLEAAKEGRWQIIAPVIGGEISTVFLPMESDGKYFESAFIPNSGAIEVLYKYSTYNIARVSHRQITRIFNHQKVFGLKTEGNDKITYTSKPNKLSNLTEREKSAKHKAIRLKRTMKKAITKQK